MTQPILKSVLAYALGGDVPEGFLNKLIERQARWEPEFRRRLDEYAYELRPDLAVWRITVNAKGQLVEERQPII